MHAPRTTSTLAAALVAGLTLAVTAPAVSATEPSSPDIVVEDGVTQPVFPFEDAIEEVVYVEAPMDSDGDGADDLIAVDVIRPAETEHGLQVPSIMEASPYFGRTVNPPPDQTRGFPGWWDEYFVPRGYAVVQVEMQGTSRSFGCPTTGGIEDTISIKAAVDWLNGRAPGYYHDGTEAVADWSTGDVGMHGVSYVGTLPNAVATEGVRGLRTVVPIAAISNWYHYVHDQGIAWSSWSENISFRYTEWLAQYVSDGRSAPGSASVPACEPVISGLGDAEQASNSDFTPFWQERSYIRSVNRLQSAGTSVFMVHGLTDSNVKTRHFVDMWREVEKRRMPRKIWLHRGGHSNPTSFRLDEWQAVMHRWMDHWLHGIANGVMDEPMADVQRPDGSWEQHDRWPDAAASDVTLRLGPATAEAAGTLSLATPSGSPTQSFVDQIQSQAIKIGNADEQRPGRLVYVTEPLAREVRLSGTPELELRVSTDATSALLSAMLVDYGEAPTLTTEQREPLELVQESCEPHDLEAGTGCAAPDATSMQITPQRVLTWGHLDAKNAADLRQAQPLTPGQQFTARWQTLPAEHVIPAGHRIGVVITGNYNASPAQYRPARDPVAVGSEITVHLGSSRITLPVVGGRRALGS